MILLLEKINKLVWGIPTMLLIMGMGLYLTVCTGFVQLRFLPVALKKFFSFRTGKGKRGATSFRALCTALAATVGTGNLAGVAGAISIGGPGAVFWMWVFALLGMVTKFAEAALAVRYRYKNEQGVYVGGTMYMITKGMPQKFHWLAGVYCFFGIVAALGVGNATQINTVVNSIRGTVLAFGGTLHQYFPLFLGIALAAVILWVFFHGADRIGKIAECLIPGVTVGYLLMSTVVLVLCADRILPAFSTILTSAFSPAAATGGAIGSAIVSLRTGASRGVFTNEAGMGTAAIAHGSAQVDHPCEQGLMGIVEVFVDTIVICTVTALVILCSGVPVPYGTDIGVQLTNNAFCALLGPWAALFLSVTLCLLAFATVLGWGLYGARCAQYLFGDGAWTPFVLLQAAAVIAGSVLGTGTVWILAEAVNGLMSIPNLIALAWLSPELIRLTKEYAPSGKKRKAHIQRVKETAFCD